MLKTIEVSEYGSYSITTNKGRDTIEFVLKKALEEIHIIHIIIETLIRFHDVPEIIRDRKKILSYPKVGTMKLSKRLAKCIRDTSKH